MTTQALLYRLKSTAFLLCYLGMPVVLAYSSMTFEHKMVKKYKENKQYNRLHVKNSQNPAKGLWVKAARKTRKFELARNYSWNNIM